MQASIYRRLLYLVSLIAISLPASSPAGEARLQQPDSNGYRAATDPLRVYLPNDWPAERLQRLAMELDGTDITRMLRRQGEFVVFTPVEPLRLGKHELRIVESLPEGDLEEIAVWTFEVRSSRQFREQQSDLSGSFNVVRKLAQSNDLSRQPVATAEGSLKLQASVADAEWRASMNAGMIYSSQAQESARRINLTDYLARLERGPAGLSVGHFSPLANSLVSAGGSYRGIGVDFGETDKRSLRAGLFVTRPDSVSGFEKGLGVSDSRNRVVGGHFTFFPVDENPERLVIQGQAFSGKGETGGEATFGGQDTSSGNGWTLRVGSRLLDGRLRLSGEYANTRWDADGEGALVQAENDRAWVLGAEWSDATVGEQPLEWVVTAKHGRVGPYFNSLLAPSTQSDQKASNLGVALKRGDWTAGMSWKRVQNNVDDTPSLPTSRLDQYALGIQRTFRDAVLGFVSAAGLTLTRDRGKPLTIPAGYLFPVANDLTDSAKLELAYALAGGNGNLALGISRYDDYNDLGPDTETRNLNLSWRRGFGVVDFAPTFTYATTRDRAGPDEIETLDLRLPLSASGLAAGRLSWSLTPALNRSRSGGDSLDTETRSLDGWINWILLTPGEQRPGVDISLVGSYQISENKVANTDSETWQVYGGVRVTF